MRKTTFSLFSSLIYFGLAIFAVKQLNQDGQTSHQLAQFLTACAFVDVFAIALSAPARTRHRSMMTPGFVRRAAKTLRLLAAVLTLPCIVYWGTGEILLHSRGDLPRWTKSVITFSKFKQQVEGEAAAKAYLGRAADSVLHMGEIFERQDLRRAYDYYSCYVELTHERWPRNMRLTAILGRILDKMGRYEEADQQYAIAERDANLFQKEKNHTLVSKARILRQLNGVSKKSLLRSWFYQLFWVDENYSTRDLGASFTKVYTDKFIVDLQEPWNMKDGVTYSGEHMRTLLSKIKMRNVPISEREGMHTVEEFDFGKPAYSATYLKPQSFQELLRHCTVIIPRKTYARLKELSELP